MVLLIAVIIGLLVGLITGGSFAGFGAARFRLLPVLFLALIIQVLIFTELVGTYEIVHQTGPYLYMLSVGAALVALVYNLHIPGMKIILLGAALNAVAIFANGGYMPTSESALREAGRIENVVQTEEDASSGNQMTHTNSVIADDDTRFVGLGDTIVIPDEFPLANVISIGDIFIALGAGYATARVTHLTPEERTAGKRSSTERIPG